MRQIFLSASDSRYEIAKAKSIIKISIKIHVLESCILEWKMICSVIKNKENLITTTSNAFNFFIKDLIVFINYDYASSKGLFKLVTNSVSLMKSFNSSCSALKERSTSQLLKSMAANILLLSEFFSVFLLLPKDDLTI